MIFSMIYKFYIFYFISKKIISKVTIFTEIGRFETKTIGFLATTGKTTI